MHTQKWITTKLRFVKVLFKLLTNGNIAAVGWFGFFQSSTFFEGVNKYYKDIICFYFVWLHATIGVTTGIEKRTCN